MRFTTMFLDENKYEIHLHGKMKPIIVAMYLQYSYKCFLNS